MTHTPGPWHADKADVVRLGDGCAVAIVTNGEPLIGRDQARANARLIAAAPDLLDSLREMESTAMRLGLTRGGNDDQEWADALLAHMDAIRRARVLLAQFDAVDGGHREPSGTEQPSKP